MLTSDSKRYSQVVELEVLSLSLADTVLMSDYQGPDFDDMSFFPPCEIDDAVHTLILIWSTGSKNSYFIVHFSSFCAVFKF